MSTAQAGEPSRDCPLCPRLVAFREEWRAKEPHWHNAPVPLWASDDGDESVRLLIVGLAPGLRGANRTGRPFTGDYAGDLLYGTMLKYGFATGIFEARPDDSLRLKGSAIVNAVRCVPPQNKPTPAEITMCRQFLEPAFTRFTSLDAVLALGSIAHQSTVRALGGKVSREKFGHGSRHEIGGITLFGSYHCSRYNTNTGVLTTEMFHAVFAEIRKFLDA
ncbi:MAG: uracil-DNA glycosylase [Methylobacterium mesophilicum]|nr:uracil-DNA glycosylase [Methylobacterium mesophilicum]